MGIQLKNNASGTLATAISASDTGIVLTTGNGANFPVLGLGDYFYATLESTGGTSEIVKVTARSGDSLTVARAQDGSTANSFAAGSRFELRVTAASTTDFLQSGTGAVVRNFRDKLRETVSVKDFGAVGDGVTDDTAAIQAAFNYATSGRIAQGVSGETYRITSTLSFVSRNFDGRGCVFVKDFAGVGISVSGGATFSYLQNFQIIASSAYAATDYVAGTQHGILVTNSRVEMSDVYSIGHIGAGFYLTQTAPNANKSKYIRIFGRDNALAGCFVDGSFPTADDFSVVEFNGQFQNNFGYGMFSSLTAPMRQWVCWIYTEANHLGVSAPDDGGVRLNRAVSCDIWCYSEETNDEFVLGVNASENIAQSVRRNQDSDLGTNNRFVSGANIYRPFTSAQGRFVTLPGFRGESPRITTSGEFVRVPWVGNNGTFGSVQGISSGGTPQIQLLSSNETKFIAVGDNGVVMSPGSIAGTTFTDALITTGGHFINASSGNIAQNSTVNIDLIENSNNFYYGKLTCIVTSSAAGSGDVTFYEVDFTYNGTTLSTSANSLNAAVVQYTAAVSLVGAKIRLSVSYTTGFGLSGRYSYRVDVVGRAI
jgi:hypothetical protein